MISQKSFQNEKPTLYLVPTPIGNLDEMMPRAIEILKMVDIIAAEDTRVTISLLKKFEINTRVIQHQTHNEIESSQGLINLLNKGYNIALVSDAGYPLISDPGQNIVELAVNNGFNVVPISGCNAALNALVASGLQVQPFTFVGFLSANKTERIKELNFYKNFPTTLIFHEAPHRIEKMLNDCFEVLGDRKICLAREITKCHEEFIRGTLSEVIKHIDSLKGEMVVVIEGYKEEKNVAIDMGNILNLVNKKIEEGFSKSEAIKDVAKFTGISKNKIYDLVHSKKN
ncbi:MAG: 16S rRNA (cytidine(1402)-2'-O)-methyltransferase [Erysipelotrichaceae bacterium]|nr:16S rRNA (cytidine(1402)-2'-O)-methyltransferase [Erysipelotrichaceae bacterium]